MKTAGSRLITVFKEQDHLKSIDTLKAKDKSQLEGKASAGDQLENGLEPKLRRSNSAPPTPTKRDFDDQYYLCNKENWDPIKQQFSTKSKKSKLFIDDSVIRKRLPLTDITSIFQSQISKDVTAVKFR
jgi:hypothetical protein